MLKIFWFVCIHVFWKYREPRTQLNIVFCFCKKLHLICLTGYWMCLWYIRYSASIPGFRLGEESGCNFKNCAHLKQGSLSEPNRVRPSDPGSKVLSRRSVIPLVVINGNNPLCRWPGVSPGIIRYSFTDLGWIEGWFGLAARGNREICWYDLHWYSNPGRSHGSTVVYPIFYRCNFTKKQQQQTLIQVLSWEICQNSYFVEKLQ